MPLGNSRKVGRSLRIWCMSLLTELSASGFLSFMSGYTVFLGPFAGIMVTDVRLTAIISEVVR